MGHIDSIDFRLRLPRQNLSDIRKVNHSLAQFLLSLKMKTRQTVLGHALFWFAFVFTSKQTSVI